MKTCPNCKAEFDDSKFYCNKCGNLLISAQTNTVQARNSQVAGNVSPKTTKTNVPQKAEKKEISDLTAGIIIAVLIVLVIAFLFG